MTFKPKTYLFAFLTWFIPMAISMFMYDKATNSYLPNLPVFKTIMLVLLFGLTYLFYKQIAKSDNTKWTSIALLFTVACSLLDMVVLIGLFKMEISMWAMAIFPFYLLSFFGFGAWLLKSK